MGTAGQLRICKTKYHLFRPLIRKNHIMHSSRAFVKICVMGFLTPIYIRIYFSTMVFQIVPYCLKNEHCIFIATAGHYISHNQTKDQIDV